MGLVICHVESCPLYSGRDVSGHPVIYSMAVKIQMYDCISMEVLPRFYTWVAKAARGDHHSPARGRHPKTIDETSNLH
jgi:hypothetical protein